MLIEPLLLEAQRGVCLQSNLMMKAMTARSSLRFHPQYGFERIFFPRSSKRILNRNRRGCSDMHWFACMSNVHIDYSFKQICNNRFWLNKVFRTDGFCSKLIHFTHACMFSHPINKQSTIPISQRLEFYILLPRREEINLMQSFDSQP